MNNENFCRRRSGSGGSPPHGGPLVALALGILLLCPLWAQGCSADGSGGGVTAVAAAAETKRATVTDILMPSADGKTVRRSDDGNVILDLSNTSEGYVYLYYGGSAERVQVRITGADGVENPYPLETGKYVALPLTGGDGSYSMNVFECIQGDMYAVALSASFNVALADEFRPYLYPNQYVNYTPESEAIKLGIELSDSSTGDLDYVQAVYNYVISNISYDYALAENVPTNYIPDPDKTIASGKGICFDYASLMTAMLRSQGIPTRLEVGYSGTAYHAWISVYLDEIGWVDNIIEFDGESWTLMDPTLGASNSKKQVKKYLGDGTNYTVKYHY